MDGLDSDLRYIVVTLVNHAVILLFAFDSYNCFVILTCNFIFVLLFYTLYVLTGGALSSLVHTNLRVPSKIFFISSAYTNAICIFF